MKRLMNGVVVLVVLLGVLVLGRNIILKFALERGVEKIAKVPLSIGKLDISLAKTHVGISELNLFNPKGFEDKIMFHAPEIFVDYDLAALMERKVHLQEVRLNFDELTVVKNEQGKLNLDVLKPKAKKTQVSAEQDDPMSDEKERAPSVRIDRLSLKIGKVVYKDYSQGGDPVISEFPVNISEEIKDVTDPQGLMGWVVSKALMQTALGSLAGFDVDMEKFSSQAVDALKGEAGTLMDKINLPFGN